MFAAFAGAGHVGAGAEVAPGSFGAMMQVALDNDGPMTVLLEA